MAKPKQKQEKRILQPGDPDYKVVLAHQKNFETLKQAFKNQDVVLMDCILKSTSEHVAVITAVRFDGTDYHFTPFAMFFNGNPYELLEPLEGIETGGGPTNEG